jgi:hypothetical protein
MNEVNDKPAEGVGGWLLVLCVLLGVWGPIELSLAASVALGALPVRGASLGLLLMIRVGVAGLGVAAGIALLGRRPAALALARASLVLSSATDVFVYATPYFPSNRMPGDEVLYIGGTLAYCSLWLTYLARSKRVRHTYR